MLPWRRWCHAQGGKIDLPKDNRMLQKALKNPWQPDIVHISAYFAC
jgi:hypothetical protein